MNTRSKFAFYSIAANVIVLTLFLALDAQVVWAQLPVRPHPGLPPRPPYVHTGHADDTAADLGLRGGYLVLQIQSATATRYWTVVEWQDAEDVWHVVDGWRGHTSDNTVGWRVAAKDGGKGPYRWLVFASDASTVEIGESQPFTLPVKGETTTAVVVLVSN